MFIFSLQYEYNIHQASEGIILKQDQTTRKRRETGREIHQSHLTGQSW